MGSKDNKVKVGGGEVGNFYCSNEGEWKPFFAKKKKAQKTCASEIY